MSQINAASVSDGTSRVLGAGRDVSVSSLPDEAGAVKKLKVLIQAYGDMTSASARIRAWHRLDSIRDQVDANIYSGTFEETDVVYIQKRVNPITLALVNEAHAAGKKVVFDIDDVLGCSASEELNIEMLRRADVITVDTRFKRDLFLHFTSKPIEVIPDGLDYFTEWFDVNIKNEIDSVCTFGWNHNVVAAVPFMQELSKKYTTMSITDIPVNGLGFIKWELPTFIENLKAFDCAFLAHGDHPNDRLRCCNRFFSAAFCGLLPVVKNTLEYRETLEELTATCLLVDNPGSINSQVEKLAKVRVPLVSALRKLIWEKYRPEIGGKKLLSVLKAVI